MESSTRKKRGQWSEEQLRTAVRAVKEGLSTYKAAEEFGVPRRTLRTHLGRNMSLAESKMKVRASIRPTHPRRVKTTQQIEKKPEEKKTNTNSSAPRVVPKTQAKRPDIFELQKPFVTSFSCVSDIVKAFSNGTDELRNLLNFECELIYECKVCRGLFRSLSNFLQHKRSHCLDRARDLRRNFMNGEVSDQLIHINGTNPKGQLIATRKTMRKDIYDILRKVGDMKEEPLPHQFFTRDIQETDAALLSFFQQEGKAATEERSATLGSDGFVVGAKSSDATRKPPKETEPTSDMRSNKQSDEASSRVTAAISRQSIDGETIRSSLKCTKCDSAFCSLDELTAHSSLQSCSKLRQCYVCPLCKKIVATPWNVYRHLRRVHNKTAEQVRKLRKNIEKRMVKAEEIKTKSSPSPARKPVLSDKTQQMMKSFGITNHVSAGVNCGVSHFSSPVVFKRGRSPDVDVSTKNRILEVRSYDKSPPFSPFKSECNPTSSKIQQSDVSVSASILNSPQPRVVLTKTHLSPSMCASLLIKKDPVDSSQTVPNSPSSVDSPPNPAKKIKKEKDLSWLKKGPSVPIIGGPLTRTARALYGSPRKLNPSENDKTVWNKSGGKISRVDVQKDESESIEAGPSRSAQDDSSENDVENPSGLDEVSPSAGDDNDSDDPIDSGATKPKETSFNKRLSSSEDNVRLLTSSVDSFDSTPSKEKNSVQDLNDRMSTSGIDTEMDRPTTTTTSSTGPSDDDSPDVDPHGKVYSKHQLASCDDYRPSQSPSDYLESMEDEQPSCHAHPPDIASDVERSAVTIESKPVPLRARAKSTESRVSRPSPTRENNEAEGSCGDLALSTADSDEMKPFLDSDDSNSSEEREEERDEQLMKNMMEVIFGSLTSTSINVSCISDSSSS